MKNSIMMGNYGRLIQMSRDGTAFFSMLITKTPTPFANSFGSFLCSGKVPEYHMGYPLTLKGHWRTTNPEKPVFEVEDFSEDALSGVVLKNYLIRECEGVGEKTAEKLSELGDELFAIVKSEFACDELYKKTGLAESICLTVSTVLKKKEEKYQLFKFLCCYGISDLKVEHLISQYGFHALDVLKKNPYKVLNKAGIPFRVADEIAFGEGFSHYDKERVKGLLYHVLNRLMGNGSTYADIYTVYEQIQRVSLKSIYRSLIPTGMISIAIQDADWIYIDEKTDRLYFKDIFQKEESIANGIRRLTASSHNLDYNPEEIADIEEELSIHYADKQREAFSILRNTKPKILTGGPGTGKTTLINGILRYYQKKYPKNQIALCAPTGMAAEHMAEGTKREASTIHRLLEYRPFHDGEASYKNIDDPIEADFVIVDETSMGDTRLMGMLLDAIQSGTLLLLCGDADQLDSVGYGAVLRDLILSDAVEVYHLDTLFRQKEGSAIISNAMKVNAQDTSLETDKSFQICRFRSREELHQQILKKVKELSPENPIDIQILSTTKKGSFGIGGLNALYQKNVMFPVKPTSRTIHRNGYVFHIGDRIMTLVNNYDAGYFNGDIGTVLDISDMGTMTIQIREKTIIMNSVWLEEIIPAYAVTIHKSQGSEFPYVFIVIPENPSVLLEKGVIYTAITRAKKKVVIFSQNHALETAIRTDNKMKRNTGLVEKLKGGTA